MKAKATIVSMKRLNIARQDEDATKMEKEVLDMIGQSKRNINAMKAEITQICDEHVDCVVDCLSRMIERLQGLTQNLMDLMEANTPSSTNVVNAHVNFDINRGRNFTAKVIHKSQEMTQEVINMKASLVEMIHTSNEEK